MAQTDKQTDRQTEGHGDSMTESAKWADSVKIIKTEFKWSAWSNGLVGYIVKSV